LHESRPKCWTKEELILALNLYLMLSFGKLHSRTPEIIHMAKIIGRTANSVAKRLNNFASVDPYHKQRGIRGLPGGIKQVQPIWDEFINNKDDLIFESEKILANKENVSLEQKYSGILRNIEHLKGDMKLRGVKTRVNQNVFGEIGLTNYDGKCAVSGIDVPAFLRASHIIPWSKNEDERLNSSNGICLSSLYDCAFEAGYIAINEKFEVVLSTELKKKVRLPWFSNYFAELDGKKKQLPKKYPPEKEFLKYHMDEVFRG